jgi:hypothetical protein
MSAGAQAGQTSRPETPHAIVDQIEGKAQSQALLQWSADANSQATAVSSQASTSPTRSDTRDQLILDYVNQGNTRGQAPQDRKPRSRLIGTGKVKSSLT